MARPTVRRQTVQKETPPAVQNASGRGTSPSTGTQALGASTGPLNLDSEVQRDENTRDLRDLKHDFDALMARYEHAVYNAVFHLIGDAEEAGDLTQETFVSAFRAREHFRGDAKVYTWLYRIAVNHCKNRFKQRDRLREYEGISLDGGFGGTWSEDGDHGQGESRPVADWSLSPEKLLEQKELRAQIYRAVEGLATEYRIVLVLREMEGLNYSEIAEVTGLTMEAVKTRLSRARAMVRRRIEPYYRL
jgi:RNA polymerase sigma-70 factor (ECF subfamily)